MDTKTPFLDENDGEHIVAVLTTLWAALLFSEGTGGEMMAQSMYRGRYWSEWNVFKNLAEWPDLSGGLENLILSKI